MPGKGRNDNCQWYRVELESLLTVLISTSQTEAQWMAILGIDNRLPPLKPYMKKKIL